MSAIVLPSGLSRLIRQPVREDQCLPEDSTGYHAAATMYCQALASRYADIAAGPSESSVT